MIVLWFKQRYVDDILSGRKTHTIRRNSPYYDRFHAHTHVLCSVGPRRPFCVIYIDRIEMLTEDECSRIRETLGDANTRVSHPDTETERSGETDTERRKPYKVLYFHIKNYAD